MQRHGADRKALLLKILQRGVYAVIKVAMGRNKMKRIGMQADLMTQVADFLQRIPHPLGAIPRIVQRVAVHGEKHAAHIQPLQDTGHLHRPRDVAMDVEFQMRQIGVGTRGLVGLAS